MTAPNRLFSPERYGWSSAAQPSQLLVPNARGTLFNLRSPRGGFVSNIIGLFIDGACPGNGCDWAEGAFGVYFGPQSPYNVNGLLSGFPQTNQRAELTAAIESMESIRECSLSHPSIHHFIIVTDSAYLVNSITDYIFRWKRNGWINSAGNAVANRDLFEILDQWLNDSAYHEVFIYFWKVDRSENEEADRLANLALQGGS
jgi:ribonuclease HI